MVSKLRVEGRGEWSHYWFTEPEEVHAKEEIVPLPKSSLRHTEMGLLQRLRLN